MSIEDEVIQQFTARYELSKGIGMRLQMGLGHDTNITARMAILLRDYVVNNYELVLKANGAHELYVDKVPGDSEVWEIPARKEPKSAEQSPTSP